MVETGWHTHRGEGWAVTVPEGARVDVRPDGLGVDAPDGRSWFDVRWLDVPANRPPQVLATAWGEERCRPLAWDLPATPLEGLWTAGGFCTIQDRRYWVVAVVERVGERSLLTGFVAERSLVSYEDLWVLALGTALSLGGGAEPVAPLTPDRIRERLREAHEGDAIEVLPVAGGGVFSTKISAAVTDLWTARRSAPPPSRFTGPLPDPNEEAGTPLDEEPPREVP